MGKGFSCKVRLALFMPDLAGYTKVKDGPGPQAMLAGKAERVRAAADTAIGEGGHEVIHQRGKFDMGYVVATDGAHAYRAQAKRKTLTRALGAAGGS